MTKPNDRSLAYAIAVFDAVLPIPCGSLPGPSADADVADRVGQNDRCKHEVDRSNWARQSE